jgi:hypothetical protein
LKNGYVMPRALPLAVREQILLLHQQQHSTNSICNQMQVSLSSVRRLLRKYNNNPTMDLQPAYNHCGPQKPRSDERLLRAGLWLKRIHPLWGAPLIHLRLEERYCKQKVPAIRTLQTWYRRKGLNAPREQGRLSSGEPACYLTIADEHSGACLQAKVFPL